MTVKLVTKNDPLSVPGRRIPKQERSKKTVELILDAAHDLLEEEGMSGMTMQKIADRAGINVAAVYSYFPNKFQVVAEIAERRYSELSRMRARHYAYLLKQDGDWIENFVGSMKSYESVRRTDVKLAVLRNALRASPVLLPLYRRSVDDAVDEMAAHLEKVDPQFKGDQRVRARVIMEAFVAVLDTAATADEKSRKAMLTKMIEMTRCYLKNGNP